MRLLSLDCLTLTDAAPEAIVDAAEAAGFDLVSLWLNPAAAFPRQVVGAADAGRIAERLAASRVKLHQIEAFNLASREAVQGYRPLFQLGARLGAATVQLYNGSCEDARVAAELLREACDIAGEAGLGVNLEPVSMGRTRSLAQAEDLIAAAQVDAGIVLDLLHHMRVGGTAAEIAAVEPGRIRYIQVNDGLIDLPAEQWLAEAMGERLYPGEGEFPIAAMLQAAPDDAIVGVEVPSLKKAAAGWSAERQARTALAALRSVF